MNAVELLKYGCIGASMKKSQVSDCFRTAITTITTITIITIYYYYYYYYSLIVAPSNVGPVARNNVFNFMFRVCVGDADDVEILSSSCSELRKFI